LGGNNGGRRTAENWTKKKAAFNDHKTVRREERWILVWKVWNYPRRERKKDFFYMTER